MGNLREEAQGYIPQTTYNVADLTSVSLDDIQIKEETKTDGDGKDFKYKYFEIDGKKYRVPGTVLEEIQKIIKLKPEVKQVKVNKTGEGLRTRYSVDVLEV